MRVAFVYFLLFLAGVLSAIQCSRFVIPRMLQYYLLPYERNTDHVTIALTSENGLFGGGKNGNGNGVHSMANENGGLRGGGHEVNSHIPPQFTYPEYEELDRHLTQRFGLPFTYKRFHPESYYYIPYGYNYTYLAEPAHFCSNDTFMVVMIMSTVKKPEEREVLRSSWFKDKTVLGKKIKYLFIVSSSPDPEVNAKIDEEAKEYNDILHMDHLDSYNNITMSIMNTFNWLHRNCHSIKYILKGDPDSYFNTPKIVKWLLDLPPQRQTRLYHGSCFITSFFIRSPGNKWDTPYVVDRDTLAWPYCIGVGYVISADLLAPLVLASRHYPYMLRTEDMSIGLAALMLNVTPYRYHDYYWTPPERYHYNSIKKCRWERYFDFHKVPLSDVPKIHSVFTGNVSVCCCVS